MTWKKGDHAIHVCIMDREVATQEIVIGDCDGRHAWALHEPTDKVVGMPAYPIHELVEKWSDVRLLTQRAARNRIEDATALLKFAENLP